MLNTAGPRIASIRSPVRLEVHRTRSLRSPETDMRLRPEEVVPPNDPRLCCTD